MAPPFEIAIPSTSVSSEGSNKPFTYYNVTIRLPLRSFVIQKRYSEFVDLHTSLVQTVGAPPPEPLPGKLWFKNTVGSPDLTQTRQLGLEKYLQTIAEVPDRRWRDTSVWRAFLNLPPTSTTTSAASAGGVSRNTAAGAADPATWLDVQRDLKACLHEARQHLSKRDNAADNGDNTAVAEAGAAAKRAIVRGGTLISTLADGLRKMQESGRLGEGELRRRRDQVSAARMEREGLDKLSNSMPNTRPDPNQASLLLTSGNPTTSRSSGRVLGAPLPETEATRELDNSGVLLLQKREMEQQDMQVDQLAAIIRRQKEMGIQINDEVTTQTEMLNQMDEDADRVKGKLKVANTRIKRF